MDVRGIGIATNIEIIVVNDISFDLNDKIDFKKKKIKMIKKETVMMRRKSSQEREMLYRRSRVSNELNQSG